MNRTLLLMFSHLGLLHLHDVGLAFGDAVVDVVDVGAQRLQLLVQGGQGAVSVCTVHRHLLSLSGHSLPPSGQILALLRWVGELTERKRGNKTELVYFPGQETS